MAKCLICYKDDVPSGAHYHEACSLKFFGSKVAPELSYSLSDMKDLARKIIQSQGVMTGVQPKISLGLERTLNQRRRLTLMTTTIGTGEFILKPPSIYYEQMPETEDLTMHLADLCKISIVPHALIPLASGELSYITRRIDRVKQSKIHMEDFCQLSGLLTEDKYKSSMEKVGKVVQQYSDYSGLDKVNLLELTLFNYITGNNDMHLKNFSLILNEGRWQLSPAYDLLNVNLVNEKDTEETALSVAGKKRKLKREDFWNLGINYGLSEVQIRNAFTKILSRQNELVDFVKKSFLGKQYKEKYTRMIKERISKLD